MSTPVRNKGGSKSKIKLTPYSKRQKSSPGCFAPFKSPSTPGSTSSSTTLRKTSSNKVDLAKDVLSLQKEIEEKDGEIRELSKNYSEDELKKHIDMLHEYNEIKDIAQMIIGKLAEVNGTTTKEMYGSFNLNVDD